MKKYSNSVLVNKSTINVACVLVTFNPNINRLIKTLKEISGVVDTIIVCNNSIDDLNINLFNVSVINLGCNLGIARAQSIGMLKAFENGSDFVLQMDQDSVPAPTMVELLLKCYHDLTTNGYKVGLVGPQDVDESTGMINTARFNSGERILRDYYFSVANTLSSGSLISRDVYNQIGGMYDDLFIDAVDSEYCWRIRNAGYLVVRNQEAIIYHNLGEGKKNILGFSVNVPSPFRHYYQFRNIILLTFYYSGAPLYWKISNISKLLLKLTVYPLFLDRGRIRIDYMIKGLFDGLMRRGGAMNSKSFFN